MSLKLKALGLSVIAAMAVSAVAVMNASANGEGHFVSEINVTHVTGFEGPGANEHRLHLTNHGLSGIVGCNTVSYKATANAATVNSLTVEPSYANCLTTNTNTVVPVDVNGCTYTFTAAKGTTNNTEQTVHLLCPAGKKIEVTHPNCTVSIHPQTINTGVTYTHITESGKNAITLDSKAAFNTTREGLCQFIAPTNGVGTLEGSATVRGFVPGVGGNQVSITAT